MTIDSTTKSSGSEWDIRIDGAQVPKGQLTKKIQTLFNQHKENAITQHIHAALRQGKKIRISLIQDKIVVTTFAKNKTQTEKNIASFTHEEDVQEFYTFAKEVKEQGLLQTQPSFKKQFAKAERLYSAEVMYYALKSVFEELDMSINMLFQEKPGENWGHRSLNDLLQMPGNEKIFTQLREKYDLYKAEFESLNKKKEPSKREVKQCLQTIVVALLQHSKRIQRTYVSDTGTYTQRFYRGAIEFQKIQPETVFSYDSIGHEDYAFSSAQDRSNFQKAIAQHNTNMGVVVHQNADKQEDIVLFRSGKTDSSGRMREACAFAALEIAKHGLAKKYFKKNADGVLTFRHTIYTLLDFSLTKSIPQKIMAFFKGKAHISDERKFLKNMFLAQDAWPAEGIRVQIPIDGEMSEVILEKPVIVNQPFSSTVRGIGIGNIVFSNMGQTTADRISFLHNYQLFEIWHKSHGLPSAMRKFKACIHKLTEEMTKHGIIEASQKSLTPEGLLNISAISQHALIEKKEFFNSESYKNYEQFIAGMLLEALNADATSDATKNLSENLYISFFRKAPPLKNAIQAAILECTKGVFRTECSVREEVHAMDLVMYRHQLRRELGLAPEHPQCKSGKDRTGAFVAAILAEEEFFRIKGYRFCPCTASEGDVLEFKLIFRQFLKEFVIKTTIEAGGYSGLNWGGGVAFFGGAGNPIAYKYLLNEQDIEKLQTHGIQETNDVKGFKRQARKQSSKKQYKGKLVKTFEIIGNYAKKHMQKIAKLKRNIAQTEFSQAAQSVNKKLQSLQNNIGAIFDENLTFQQSIAPLKKYEETLQADLESLKTQIKEMKKTVKHSGSKSVKSKIKSFLHKKSDLSNKAQSDQKKELILLQLEAYAFERILSVLKYIPKDTVENE